MLTTTTAQSESRPLPAPLADAQAWRAAATAALPLLLIAALSWPMLLTSSSFGGDWQNHLWYVWQQSLALRADHAPSSFLNLPHLVFYPEYLFYGATTNAIVGAVAVALGNSATAAYVLTYVLGFLAAYAGWYWLSRMASLGRWTAHAPALTFLTSACYLNLVYGQGDWLEFLAVSAMPLMIASGLSVLRAQRIPLWPCVALAASCVVFFGSHNLTMLWGSTVLAAVALLAVACIPEARRLAQPRRLLRVAAIVVPAALVDAWFLLPALAYASNTKISSQFAIAEISLRDLMWLVEFRHLFTFSRASVASSVPDYPLALPTLAILWVAASLVVILWRVRRGPWLRLLVLLCASTAVLVVLMTHAGLLLALPKPYAMLQFSYRLESYILMGVSASVLASLALLRQGSRRLQRYRWTILPIVAASVVGAIQQVDAYPHTAPRSDTFLPEASPVAFTERHDDYGYAGLPLIYGKQLPQLSFSASAIRNERLSMWTRARPGQLVYTNIAGGPDLLDIAGARAVGHDTSYRLVLALGPSTAPASAHPRGAVADDHITIAPANHLPTVLGRLLSLGALITLLLELGWLLAKRRRLAPG
jgi:hypothetical protein